jgi:hypothetical protein
MGDRKPRRDIALSLAAGGVLALGLGLYALRSVQGPDPATALIEGAADSGDGGANEDEPTFAADGGWR